VKVTTQGEVRLVGRIVHGHGRGQQLGFATANVQVAPDAEVRLPGGVWAAWIRWPGQEWRAAVANIGCCPTFGGTSLSVEVHVLDFSGDLYGSEVDLRLVRRLREERPFADARALTRQIAIDAGNARALLGQRGKGSQPTEERQCRRQKTGSEH